MVRISWSGSPSSCRGSSCPSAWPARAPVGAQATVRSRGRGADGSGSRRAAPKAQGVLFRVRVFCSVRLLVRAVRRLFFGSPPICRRPGRCLGYSTAVGTLCGLLRSPLFAAQPWACKGLLRRVVSVRPVGPHRVVARPGPPRGRRVFPSAPWLQYGSGDAALMARAVAVWRLRCRRFCSAFVYSVPCAVKCELCGDCFRPAANFPAPRPLPWLQYGRADAVWVAPVFATRSTALGAQGHAAVSVSVGPVGPRRVVARPALPRGRRVLPSVPRLQYGPGDAALMARAVASRRLRRMRCCSAFVYSVLCAFWCEQCDDRFFGLP